MGIDRSRHCLSHYSLSAMRILPHRVSANDQKGVDAGPGQRALRAESFSEGILLRGLPLHLEQRRTERAISSLAPVLSRQGKRRRGISPIQLSARPCRLFLTIFGVDEKSRNFPVELATGRVPDWQFSHGMADVSFLS